MVYRALRELLFRFDAERAHGIAMDALELTRKLGLARLVAHQPAPLPVQAFGLSFPNPVGLAAGFDKNAEHLSALQSLGFGFIEIGTVTPKPQPGNERPRLFRLPQDKALINRMGFNNAGMNAMAENLGRWRARGSAGCVIGGNIGKNKATANEDAWRDYVSCFKTLDGKVDYFVVNVSSPNTPGLRELQEKEALRKILSEVQAVNSGSRPLLLKISPDLNDAQLRDVLDLAGETKLAGIVAANTTTGREGLKNPLNETGGLSGKPLKERSLELLRTIRATAPQLPVISSGGIFTGRDAAERMDSGAALVQVWTGFIYEGPGIAGRITEYLRAHKRFKSS